MKYILLLLLSLLPTPFNLFALEWPVPFEQNFVMPEGKIAVVSGAGPAGFLAVQAILEAGLHDHIILIENRDTFKRFNQVNYFPESWPMLERLHVAQPFRKVSSKAAFFKFNIAPRDAAPLDFTVDHEEIPSHFDYFLPLEEILDKPRVGLQVANLADLQYELANNVKNNSRVHILYGTLTVSPEKDDNLHSVEIREILKPDVTHRFKPDFIVISEGAHSINRTNVGIGIVPVLKKQLWCSGAVSLKNILETKDKFMHVNDIFGSGDLSIRNFGIFNVIEDELFLNAEARIEESTDDCLKRNALGLVKPYYTGQRTLLVDDFHVTRTNPTIIEIEPSRAQIFTSGQLILFGDAAGYGTSKGGIGLSLVTTVYSQALLDLLAGWEKNRFPALSRYNERASEIVDYWHSKIASHDIVI